LRAVVTRQRSTELHGWIELRHGCSAGQWFGRLRRRIRVRRSGCRLAVDLRVELGCVQYPWLLGQLRLVIVHRFIEFVE
jgi:hypothetical protein